MENDDKELEALSTVARALSEIDQDARSRVLSWAAQRFGIHLPNHRRSADDQYADEGEFENQEDRGEFVDFADLFNAVNPKTEVDKALAAAYWIQKKQGQASFQSLELNQSLKNLGHGVANITDALSTAQSRKPALVMQTRKSGTSRQARKTYKMTRAGEQYIEGLLQ